MLRSRRGCAGPLRGGVVARVVGQWSSRVEGAEQLRCAREHHVGVDAGAEPLAVSGREGGLVDAHDRTRVDGVLGHGPRAHAGLHSAARVGVQVRDEEGEAGSDGSSRVRVGGRGRGGVGAQGD